MTYKEAKRIRLSDLNLKFKVADIYKNTGSFSKQYKDAKSLKNIKFIKV